MEQGTKVDGGLYVASLLYFEPRHRCFISRTFVLFLTTFLSSRGSLDILETLNDLNDPDSVICINFFFTEVRFLNIEIFDNVANVI